MPCIKCSNGKWKYGEHGKCQFDTLEACKAAAAAIHIGDKGADPTDPKLPPHVQPVPGDWHDPACQCYGCKACKPK